MRLAALSIYIIFSLCGGKMLVFMFPLPLPAQTKRRCFSFCSTKKVFASFVFGVSLASRCRETVVLLQNVLFRVEKSRTRLSQCSGESHVRDGMRPVTWNSSTDTGPGHLFKSTWCKRCVMGLSEVPEQARSQVPLICLLFISARASRFCPAHTCTLKPQNISAPSL